MEIINQVNASPNGKNIGGSSGGTVDYLSIGQKGQIIDGVITKVDQRISIDFNGKEIYVPKSAVNNAREGEIRRFEITDVSAKGIVLKEIQKNSDVKENQKAAITSTKVDTDAKSFADKLEKAADEQEEEQESPKEVLSRLDDLGNRMTEEDYRDLTQEGMSIETYNLERLEKALNRIKEDKRNRKESIEGLNEHQQEYQENIENIVLHNVISSVIGTTMARQIAYRLESANLPVTAENIKKVANLAEMAGVTAQMSDKAMKYLIDNQLEPTIENIYHAQYAGSSLVYKDYVPNYGDGFQRDGINYDGVSQRTDDLTVEENWQEIKPQVEKMLKDAGVEANEEIMKQAKWLFSNELPVTEDTLQKLQQLHTVKSENDQEQILTEIVKNYAKGEPLEKTLLTIPNDQESAQRVEAFLQEIDTALSVLHIDESDIEAVTARRQMEEIRLKMTLQAGNSLVRKGIHLQIQNMEQMIQQLREMEDEYYRGIIYERDGVDSSENIEMLRSTTDCVNELKEAPSYVLGSTLAKINSITLSELHKEARSMKLQLDKAGETYTTLMTQPRKDLGDSIQKAFGNIDDILTDMDMEITIDNRRAVKILGYNSMPITEENIANVKAYDGQVNQLLKNLHPAVTVEMIKKNINPLDTPIEELNIEITNMKQELGITDEERYSRYLWKLERENNISPEERKAYIGIYRLLNNVEKSDGAAVGQVLDMDREVTLKNLLSAVKTIKTGKIEEVVDDNFGLDTLRYTREPLLEQVNEVFEKGKTTKKELSETKGKYFDRVVSDLMEEITPQKLEKTVENLEKPADKVNSIMNKTVEKLLEDMRTEEEVSKSELEYEQKMLAQIKELSGNCEQAIEFLNSYKIPVNIQNLFAANQLLNNQSIFKTMKNKSKNLPEDARKKVESAMDGLVEGLEDKDTMQAQYEALEEGMELILDQEYAEEENTSEDMSNLRLLANGMNFVRSLSRKERYEIPIVTGDRVTNLHVTIVNGEQENGKVDITMNSEKLGNVTAQFSLRENEVIGTILSDNLKANATLKNVLEDLEQRLNLAGIEVRHINYGMRNRSTDAYKMIGNQETQTNADTKVLYQTAKAFVQHITTLEKA